MNRLFFVLFFLLASFSVNAEIIEAKHFKELKGHVGPETLVILDIDDTLLIPVQTLGTDVWFIERLKHHQEASNDPALALDKALAEWEAVRHLTQVKLVEQGADDIVRKIQTENIPVMGLTTQGLALATRTVNQLLSLNIDLTKTAPSPADHYFINGPTGVLYRKGILFTSGTPKGDALLKFFESICFFPKKIVFINDKLSHLREVETAVVQKGICFIGLRYSYSDERVADYRPEIAAVQWNNSTFSRIVSDEEALILLKKTAEK